MKFPQVLWYNCWKFQFSQSRLKTSVNSKCKFNESHTDIISKLSTYLCCLYCVLIGTFSLSNLSLSMQTITDLNKNWYFILYKSRNSQLSFSLQPYLHLLLCIHYSEGLYFKVASHECINIFFKSYINKIIYRVTLLVSLT